MTFWIRSTCAVALAASLIAAGPGVSAQIVTLQTLRGAAGVGYEALGYEIAELPANGYDDRQLSPVGTLEGALAILDPGILLIDGYGDFRWDRFRRSSSALHLQTRSGFRDLRLGMTVLAARGAPLRLFYSRIANRVNQDQQLPGTEAARRHLSLTGRQASKGFTWQFGGRGRLPQINAIGSVINRHDEGEFVSSGELRNRERTLDLRAGRSGEQGRYELSYSHRGIRQQFPSFGIESSYGNDLLRAQTTIKPAERLTLDIGGHYSSHMSDRENGESLSRRLQGGGGDGALTWEWSPRWTLATTYAFSNNVAELALADASLPADLPPGGLPIDLPASSRDNINYQNGTMTVRFTARQGATTASFGPRVLVLDPVRVGLPVLDEMQTVHAQIDHQFRAAGLDISTGANAAAGRVVSNAGDREPYQERGARLRLSRRLGAAQLGVDGAFGDSTGPWFHPVAGQSWRGGFDVATNAPSWAHLRAAASHSRLMRDTFIQQGVDYSRSYSAGLSGRRYDIAIDYNDVRSTATGLQDLALLAVLRPDVIAATRRDLFGLLYGTDQQSGTVQARFTVLPGFEISARGLVEHRVYPGVYELRQRSGRVAARWSIGTSQIEAGVERYRLQWTAGLTHNNRFYVRVLRNFTIF